MSLFKVDGRGWVDWQSLGFGADLLRLFSEGSMDISSVSVRKKEYER